MQHARPQSGAYYCFCRVISRKQVHCRHLRAAALLAGDGEPAGHDSTDRYDEEKSERASLPPGGVHEVKAGDEEARGDEGTYGTYGRAGRSRPRREFAEEPGHFGSDNAGAVRDACGGYDQSFGVACLFGSAIVLVSLFIVRLFFRFSSCDCSSLASHRAIGVLCATTPKKTHHNTRVNFSM